MTNSNILVGDVGGTNARFALATSGAERFEKSLDLQCADFATASEAIEHYLEQTQTGPPAAICIAAAGAVIDGVIDVTNNHWRLAEQDLRAVFGTDTVRLLNDFAAVAYAIPLLQPKDLEIVGPAIPANLPEGDFRVAVLGPGTGLGIAGLYRRAGVLTPITGEGGHSGFAPATALQIAILKVLMSKFGRVSTERLVSGAGLVDIHAALAEVRGETSTVSQAAEVFALAADEDSLATTAVDVFFEILGQVAGDLALTLGATDGVYIGGGISRRYPDMLANSSFRAAFENKGRYRSLMESIGTRLIMHEQTGLLGAAFCALELTGRN
jgi:glucokinase